MSKKTKACNYFGDCGMGNDSCYLWVLILLALGGNNNNFGNMLGLGNNNPVSTIVLLMLLCGFGND